MRVFVAGATGAIGHYLIPGLIAAGHEVTGTRRSPSKASRLTNAGATPAIVDGLDWQAVLSAVKAAQPDVIVHQMTALASMRSFRSFDQEFAAKRELGWSPRYPSWRDGFPDWIKAAHDHAA
jgi:nucleoside-diphosphate-sugar epimerase